MTEERDVDNKWNETCPAVGMGEVVLVIGRETPNKPKASNEPATDFVRLRELLGAVIVGSQKGGRIASFIARIEKATAMHFTQALRALTMYPDADVYISFSENVGIPLALLLRLKRHRPRHMMIAHRLNTRKKRLLNAVTGWSAGVDRIVVVCGSQEKYAGEYLPGASTFVKYGTDDQFYTPSNGECKDYVLSLGNECRDYQTLLSAIANTDLQLKIVASSPWSRNKDSIQEAPERVELLPRLEYDALRRVYQEAKFVVLPLHDVDYAAGLTTVMESFCMRKPLIVSGSRGILDHVSHMENAYVVQPGSVEEMQNALQKLDQDSDLREKLRAGADKAVKEFCTLDSYLGRLISEMNTMLSNRKDDRRS